MTMQIQTNKGGILEIQQVVASMDLSESTVKSYNLGINLFFAWHKEYKAEKEFKDLSMYDYIEYKRWLNQQPYSINTKNSYLTGVMAMYKTLEKHGIVNICAGIRLFDNKIEHSKDGVTLEEWQHILSIIPKSKFNGMKHYLIMYMLFISGVRQMSLRELKWGDFGYSSKVKCLVMEVLLKGRGQNRREKVILSDECVKLLEEYKFMYMKHYHDIRTGKEMELDPKWYVFGNRNKKLADPSIRKITTQWMKKGNVYVKGEITPHCLRHGIAEHLIDLGMPLTAVQSLLCHKSINSTKVYAGKREKMRVDKELLGKLNDIKLI